MSTFEPHHDKKRIASQRDCVRNYMLACAITRQWRTLAEISVSLEAAHHHNFPHASVSARLRDLRKMQYGGYTIERRRRGHPAFGLFEYRLLAPVSRVAEQMELMRSA